MIGGAVILNDPIFQGLAISLLFGLASSMLLTVLVIPAIYRVLRKRMRTERPDSGLDQHQAPERGLVDAEKRDTGPGDRGLLTTVPNLTRVKVIRPSRL